MCSNEDDNAMPSTTVEPGYHWHSCYPRLTELAPMAIRRRTEHSPYDRTSAAPKGMELVVLCDMSRTRHTN